MAGSKLEELADLTMSFLEVAVHTVLFARGVYPEAIFERRKEYGVAVWMSRHPELNDCIFEMLAHARPHLLRGVIDAFVLVLLDGSTGAALEQYRFAVDLACPEDVPATYSDLETMFAAAIAKLASMHGAAAVGFGAGSRRDGSGASDAAGRRLKRLPKDCSFTILLEVHEDGLTGPNDRAAHDAFVGGGGAAGGRGGGAAAGGGGGAHIGGVLGTGGPAVGPGSTENSSAYGPYWTALAAGDPEAGIMMTGGGSGGAAAAGAAGAAGLASSSSSSSSSSSAGPVYGAYRQHARVHPLKTIRAGPLGMDVTLEVPR